MLRCTIALFGISALLAAGCDRPSDPPPAAKQETSSQRMPDRVAPDSAPAVASSPSTETTPPDNATLLDQKPIEPPPEVAGLKRLGDQYDVWLDPQQKQVLVGGTIVRREGQLEMFACLKNTKEHESIVAANTKAVNVNAGLIAIGANPGGPVQFRPEFKPASGPEVEVTVIWTDPDGKRRKARAQDWIRDMKTSKPLTQPWVFGGSGFWEEEGTGERHFMAEDGDFICISNFTSAMLDLPVESSQATADLQFEAFTENIPPLGTQVLLVLKPKLDKAEPDKAAPPKAESETPKS